MTKDEAITRIQLGLGFRTTQATNIGLLLKEAQRELEMSPILPWFLLTEDATLSGVALNPDLNLPTGFLQEDENERPRFVETSGRVTFMTKGNFEALTYAFQQLASSSLVTSTGLSARSYCLRLNTIRVFPTPTVTYSVKMSYFKKEATLDAGATTNKWLDESYFPDLIIGKAGKKMARILQNTDAYAEFERMEAMAGAAIQAHTIDREIAAGEFSLGSEM